MLANPRTVQHGVKATAALVGLISAGALLAGCSDWDASTIAYSGPHAGAVGACTLLAGDAGLRDDPQVPATVDFTDISAQQEVPTGDSLELYSVSGTTRVAYSGIKDYGFWTWTCSVRTGRGAPALQASITSFRNSAG